MIESPKAPELYKTSVFLTRDQREHLREIGYQRRIELSRLIREAIDKLIAEYYQESGFPPTEA